MNFSVLLAAYFEDLRVKNWSEATIDRRQHSLNRFCLWLQDRSIERLDAVTPDLIAAYQRNLYTKRTYAPRSHCAAPPKLRIYPPSRISCNGAACKAIWHLIPPWDWSYLRKKCDCR
ncbi:site-specific integrase [Pirellulaceae bacterium SH449]